MAKIMELKFLIFFLISCLIINSFINANPLNTKTTVKRLQSLIDQNKVLNIIDQKSVLSNFNKNLLNSDNDEDDSDKKENDDKKDDDKKDDKKENDEKKDDDKKDDKEVDDKKEEKKDDDKDSEEKKEEKKEDEKKEEKKEEEKKKKVDEKLDDNQKETKVVDNKFDDSSEEEDSHSNPDTEEEGDSQSESDEDDKLIDEKEPENGKLEKKLLIILASGLRYDYLNIPKLKTIKEILKNGVTPKYVKPVFPTNFYPNHYSLMTGLHPIKHGFIDNEMYDTKYKEEFPGKNPKHKHWWNKAEPLWVTAIKNKIKVATYWWRGACGITIKTRRPKNCIPYKEKVSNTELSKQLENIVELFSENKLDLALVSYDKIDDIGHEFGPESFKLRQAVRKFDKVLEDLKEDLEEKKVIDKVNIVVVSDHGMVSIGEKIELEKYIDFNDIDKFVNSGTFAMLLPENTKEDFVFNVLRNAHIEGLNVYRKPDFPTNFNYGKTNSELILPIVITTDKGYYIAEPNLDKKLDTPDDDDDDEPKKGNHGYLGTLVKEMNTAMFAVGPDFEKNRIINSIEQVDLYNLFCKLLKIKPLKNDGNKDIVDDFLHNDDSSEHEDEVEETKENDSGEAEDGYIPDKRKNEKLPVIKSRWASRSAASSISLNLILKLIITSVCLLAVF